MTAVQLNIMDFFGTPVFGISLSIFVYLIGIWLFKITNGFFLFQPLFVGMVLGIFSLWLMAKTFSIDVAWLYRHAYKPGGDILFWFLTPATIAFAVPLYKRNDIIKRFWLEIGLSLTIGLVIALFGIYWVYKLFGLSDAGIASLLPQAATTAFAMPIAEAIGGNSAITAMACIVNAVIIYALANFLLKAFRLTEPISQGLSLGSAGHAVGSAKALQLGSVTGSMASVAFVLISIVVDLIVPVFTNLVGITP
ncbi:LrgB family protein [Lentilactobacillus sp. TOM.63]|uniref:LrgB family protein n=1 Tax=Lentilactobacillus sp. TOM.63 TaxID=3055077 RepID=UPI0025A1666B|nr:LrgB family protein [Lentilactobacillus sp. TOM.63]MDM7515256.1 LrgB family protein [Lentilactobacillus sp. TOM.63]